jgi:hypothetical protein
VSKKKNSSSKASKSSNSSRRTVFVFSTLVGALSVTAALLLVLAPAPLAPTASSSLFAVDAPESLDAIFDTRVPVTSNRWKYIYIHHSRTAAGNALTLSKAYGTVRDHFVVCNGDGAVDGEIQVGHRWNQQTTALPPRGIAAIDSKCVSICLVGDFDQTTPTPTQLRRLAQLTSTLQAKFRIPPENILLVDQPDSAASIGKYFPATAFKQQVVK